jgi:hypothetical protein
MEAAISYEMSVTDTKTSNPLKLACVICQEIIPRWLKNVQYSTKNHEMRAEFWLGGELTVSGSEQDSVEWQDGQTTGKDWRENVLA